MKSLAILAAILIIIFGAVAFWAMNESASDQGHWIAFAFGGEETGTIEMHLAIDMGMGLRDPPKLSPKCDPLWDLWVAEHFIMSDEAGNTLEASRASSSPYISAEECKGAAEWFIAYELNAGASYTLDFKPRTTEAARYRHEFVAPVDAEKMVRSLFRLAEGEEKE